MTYEEIVAKAKKEFGTADVSNYEGHLALQINVTGEGEGIFYAEITDGKLFIEPYDYKDNDAVLTADGGDIVSIFSGLLDPVEAFENGLLSVTGDISKALSIQPVIENNKKASKKTTKKSTAKANEKTTSRTVKASAKTTKSSTKNTESDESAIIGMSEPKKSLAPKTASKKASSRTVAKESTKPVKPTAKTTAKKG